jgi:hypothetical protein
VSTSVLEKHSGSIFKAEMKSVRKFMVYMGLGEEPG